ncbi:uncharacterized protein V1510DRAFT_363859 [Dipodascopsis tothii]|uniref:uncharacterized protein n=1 Tax=Dipodascopsis tothii TaxID=44089 RepID=UPI0034CFD729
MSTRGFFFSAVFMLGLFSVWASMSSSSSPSAFVPYSAIITSAQTNKTFPARPAAFGPSLTFSPNTKEFVPFAGELHVMSSLACPPSGRRVNSTADDDVAGKIAVVLRGDCSFYEKVLTLQTYGAVAVIVGDVEGTRGLLTMSSKGGGRTVSIPSFFVAHSSYLSLRELETISIIPSQPPSPILDTLLFVLVSPLLSLSFIYALLIFHRRYKRIRDRAPKAFVSALPTRVWAGEGTGREKHWGSAGECVICLEDYVPSVSLVMRLPCGHEFHEACITPWLTLRKRTCPICKRDVTATGSQLVPSASDESGDPDLEESRQQFLQHQQNQLMRRDSSSSSGPSTDRTHNLIDLAESDNLYDTVPLADMPSSSETTPEPAAADADLVELDSEPEPAPSQSSTASQEHTSQDADATAP